MEKLSVLGISRSAITITNKNVFSDQREIDDRNMTGRLLSRDDGTKDLELEEPFFDGDLID